MQAAISRALRVHFSSLAKTKRKEGLRQEGPHTQAILLCGRSQHRAGFNGQGVPCEATGRCVESYETQARAGRLSAARNPAQGPGWSVWQVGLQRLFLEKCPAPGLFVLHSSHVTSSAALAKAPCPKNHHRCLSTSVSMTKTAVLSGKLCRWTVLNTTRQNLFHFSCFPLLMVLRWSWQGHRAWNSCR